MTQSDAVDESASEFTVVRNDEDQYSIWPSGCALPAGWYVAGPTASKAECLEHNGRVWTDMRPLSLRRAMDADRRPSSPPDA